MRRLIAFEQISVDGFFVDAKGDMSWAHKYDQEWSEFAASNAKREAALLFGRVTYELMVRFWPTPAAREQAPDVAEGMNNSPKFVFSRKLDKVDWKNTTLVKSDPVEQVRKMKSESGPVLVIMGSGMIVSQLAGAGLIDEFQMVVNPIVLGRGRTLFEGVKDRIDLKCTKTRAFGNGNVLVCYEPMA